VNRLEIELRIEIGTALHTTGNQRRLGVDKAQALDVQDQPVLPATTLKGFLRARAEQILRSWGHQVCMGPGPDSMCGENAPCLVCRVFGNPRFRAPLRFRDAHPDSPGDSALAVRSGVAISRYRRAAYPQRLFFLETAGPYGTQWRALCEGYFSDRGAALEAAALVALAARWGYAIGGGRTRGLGWIEGVEVLAAVDGAPLEPSALARFWLAWERGSHVAEA